MNEFIGPIIGALLLSWIAGLGLAGAAALGSRFVGFGSYVWGSSLLVRVGASVEPPTSLGATMLALSPWEGIQRIRSVTGQRVFPGPGVVHSLAYRDPAAIATIAGWVRNVAELAPLSR